MMAMLVEADGTATPQGAARMLAILRHRTYRHLFAAQVIACDRELHLDHAKLNVHGGAISLGHPIGCTGTRITTTLLHALHARGAKLGLATLCISGGMGLAMIVETC